MFSPWKHAFRNIKNSLPVPRFRWRAGDRGTSRTAEPKRVVHARPVSRRSRLSRLRAGTRITVPAL
ncbi:MAG: hypothetical protein ACYS99_20155, partial [Planctomycetota bacterium]